MYDNDLGNGNQNWRTLVYFLANILRAKIVRITRNIFILDSFCVV